MDTPTSGDARSQQSERSQEILKKKEASERSPLEFRLFHDLAETTYVFLLVNPSSGGNAATVLLNVGFNYLEFEVLTQRKRPKSSTKPSASVPAPSVPPAPSIWAPSVPAPKPQSSYSSTREREPERNTTTQKPDHLVRRVPVKLFISNITNGTSGNKDVFHVIKAVAHTKHELNRSRCNVRVMVAGGDGTIMWAFSELQRHGIDRETVMCGIVPFGTGNDFANEMGTHFQIHIANESKVDMMKRLTAAWLELRSARFDLWSVKLDCHTDGGYFEKIDSKTRKKKLLTSEKTNLPLTTLEYAMANYFSLGIESRIGVGFDRNRTKNVLLNKGTYALEGFKKLAFHKSRLINNWIQKLTIADDDGDPETLVFQSLPRASRFSTLRDLLSTKIAHITGMNIRDSETATISKSEEILKNPADSLLGADLGVKRSETSRGSADVGRTERLGNRDPETETETATEIINRRNLSSEGKIRPATSRFNGLTDEKRRSKRFYTNDISDISDDDDGLSEPASLRNLEGTSFNACEPVLSPCVSMCFLNIPSFAGGLNIWNAAKGNLGANLPPTCRNFENPIWQRMCSAAHSGKQDYGDAKLEIVTFKSLLELTLANVTRLVPSEISPTLGWRLFQGGGLYRLYFRKELTKEARIYLQVDGEFFIAHRPKLITIRPDSQVRILVHPSRIKQTDSKLSAESKRRRSVLEALDYKVQDVTRPGDAGGSFLTSHQVAPLLPHTHTHSDTHTEVYGTDESALKQVAQRLITDSQSAK